LGREARLFQAAAAAPTLDELLAKISAMVLDLLPDNHPGVDPRELFLQPPGCAKPSRPQRKMAATVRPAPA
jgi:hypothetical protein